MLCQLSASVAVRAVTMVPTVDASFTLAAMVELAKLTGLLLAAEPL